MTYDLLDGDSSVDISIEHSADQIYAVFAHNVRYSKVTVHYLVDAVERILLVDNGVEKDAESPDILLLAAVRLASENFWRCII